MAHMQKFTRSAAHGILSHDERNKSNDKQYRNVDIDNSKTHLNYSYLDNSSAEDRLNKRLKEVDIYKRPNIKVLCSWVVTLPKEIKSEDERKFFDLTYEFLSQKYGQNNVISADVHKDETTPHLHFTFVPVVPNNKKNAKLSEKVSSKEVLTQSHLKQFHTELNKYISKSLGYDAGILNGATKQNKTIKQLKQETASELEKLKNISELPEKSGFFGKILISAEKYQTLKNAPNEIKKLTEDYINSKNGEMLKSVLAENENLKAENADLNNELQKAQQSINTAQAEADRQIKQAQAEADRQIKQAQAKADKAIAEAQAEKPLEDAKTLIYTLMRFAHAYQPKAPMDTRIKISQTYLKCVENGFIDHDQYNEKPKRAEIQKTNTKSQSQGVTRG